MRPTKLLPVSLLPFLCLIYLSSTAPTTAGTSLASGPGGLPFNVTYLFTATLGLGQPPSEIKSNPITIFGGVRVPEPILNGTVSGPYLNGTITAGLAAPAVYNTGTLQVPTIDLYGVTADGDPLRIHETGIGSPSAQITRIELEVGGGSKYAQLRDGFILATVNPSSDRTTVVARGYLVQNMAATT